jgi:hypothetical protein
MKVLTKYPVYINRKKVSGADLYMNFDSNGKPTNSSETKIFQDWLDAKYPTWVNGSKLNKGSGYGKYPFGPATAKAWAAYGTQFVTEAKATIGAGQNVIAPVVTTSEPTQQQVVTTSEPTQQQKDEAAKKGIQWDKLKGWVNVATQAGQQSGVFDAILNKFGLGTTSTTPVTTTPEGGGTAVLPGGGSVTVTTPEEEAKKKRRKMLIIGGVAVVVIVAAVLLLRKKGDSATTTPAPAK